MIASLRSVGEQQKIVVVGRQIFSDLVSENALHQALLAGWRGVQPERHQVDLENASLGETQFSAELPRSRVRVIANQHNQRQKSIGIEQKSNKLID